MRVLLAEDDPGLRTVLARALGEQGYIVDAASDGEEALYLASEHEYAVAIIDWRMPKVTGVEVVEKLRNNGTPAKLLMLTARDAPADRVTGLDAGADDYLVKPFDLDELFARVRALMRRQGDHTTEVRCGDLVFDYRRAEVTAAGKPVGATATERAILEVLMRAAPGVVSRRSIADQVWPDDLDGVGSNTIDVHMARLRSKLAWAGVRIVTVRGSGFRIEAEK